jgi:hypothetical protein
MLAPDPDSMNPDPQDCSVPYILSQTFGTGLFLYLAEIPVEQVLLFILPVSNIDLKQPDYSAELNFSVKICLYEEEHPAKTAIPEFSTALTQSHVM